MCDKIRDMKARYGIEAFMFDPWNKLEMPDLNRNTETNWIGKCLDDLATLAKVLEVHIMILAHPSKPNEYKVLQAVKILFESADDIEIFNKKAVYLYMREITGLNTKQIVNNLNKIRVKYRDFRKKWNEG